MSTTSRSRARSRPRSSATPDAPKGQVSVDVQAGVANLRGELADEGWIARLADEAAKVDGIKGVNNLLHAPGTPAPSPEPQGTATEGS